MRTRILKVDQNLHDDLVPYGLCGVWLRKKKDVFLVDSFTYLLLLLDSCILFS